MPNIKSQKKRVLTNNAANARNSARKSEVRTAVKKVEALVAEGKKDEANVALNKAISLLDKAGQDKLFAHNTVSRKKAHLQKLFATLA